MRLTATAIRIARAKAANGTYPDLETVRQALDSLAEMVDSPASVAPGESFRLYKWRLKWFA